MQNSLFRIGPPHGAGFCPAGLLKFQDILPCGAILFPKYCALRGYWFCTKFALRGYCVLKKLPCGAIVCQKILPCGVIVFLRNVALRGYVVLECFALQGYSYMWEIPSPVRGKIPSFFPRQLGDSQVHLWKTLDFEIKVPKTANSKIVVKFRKKWRYNKKKNNKIKLKKKKTQMCFLNCT